MLIDLIFFSDSVHYGCVCVLLLQHSRGVFSEHGSPRRLYAEESAENQGGGEAEAQSLHGN
jgi:hypothetical protein